MPSTFSITTQKKASFYANQSQAHGAVNTSLMLVAIARIKPFSRIQPTELSISYGMNQDGTLEGYEFFLAAVDEDNIPSVSALRRDSYWQAIQIVNQLSSGGTVMKMLDRDLEDFFASPPWSNMGLAQRQRSNALAILTSSTQSATLVLVASGTLFYTEELVQFVWGNDNITFNSWDSEVGGLIAEDWEE